MYAVDDLLKHVTRVGEVANSSALVPIAKTILFASTPDGPNTVLKATDFQTSIVDNVPFLPYVGFDYCVDAQKLIQLLKSLKGEKIDIGVGENRFKVTSAHGKYELPYLDGSEFPEIEIIKGENKAPAYLLERALELTMGSVSSDDLRPTMTGVHFDTELGYVVATNGHKLTRYKSQFKGESFTLPTRAYNLLKGYGDAEVSYHLSSNAIHFSIFGDNVSEMVDFKVTRVEGNYPPYNKVIPTENTKEYQIPQKDLLEAVKRVSLFSSQDSNTIALELGDEQLVTGKDESYGNSAKETLQGKYNSDPIKIGLNSKYLIELLNTSGEGLLTLSFSEVNKPVLISNTSNPKLLQLVMPIQI